MIKLWGSDGEGMQHTWGSAYRVLVGKPEEKKPLGRPKLRWTYKIKMDIIKPDAVVSTGFIWL
jgi:hypothetical protein